MLTKLRLAEKKLPAMLADIGSWKGGLVQESGLAKISLWRQIEDLTAYHVVIQILDGHLPMQYVLAEQEYACRVVKGIGQLTIGADFESGTSSGPRFTTQQVLKTVLAAGSQFHNNDPGAWEHFTPITKEVMLVRVCYADKEPPYAGGDHLNQKTLEWAIGRFRAIYG